MLGELQLPLDHVRPDLGLPAGCVHAVVHIKAHQHAVPEPSLAPKILLRQHQTHVLVLAGCDELPRTLHGVVDLIRVEEMVVFVCAAALDVIGTELFQVRLDRLGRAHTGQHQHGALLQHIERHCFA